VTVCSGGFFVLFIAFGSAQNLSSKVMEVNGLGSLGFYSLGTLYLVFGLTSFLATGIARKLGLRWTHTLGAFCYFFWILSFLLPASYPKFKHSGLFLFNPDFITFVLLLSAGINGVGAGMLWVAQGKYISDCAQSIHTAFYFSYFQAWFMAS